MSSMGRDIIAGLEDALAFAQGDESKGRETNIEVPTIDVRALRARLGMTQGEFAATFGFSVGSVRNWEQGIRRPERAARLLLALIEKEPKLVRSTLEQLTSPAA